MYLPTVDYLVHLKTVRLVGFNKNFHENIGCKRAAVWGAGLNVYSAGKNISMRYLVPVTTVGEPGEPG